MRIPKFPKVNLGFFPTPLTELKRLSAYLGGPRIFIKRDDQTGLATGGNKTRKLEYLIGEAISLDCDSVVTGGAPQSNHCRQTVAAANVYGLNCCLQLGGHYTETLEGNVLLDNLLGACIHWDPQHRRAEGLQTIANNLAKRGSKPYVIPYGGSNAVGALGYVSAVGEIQKQLKSLGQNISHIIFASSSGGTQAGLTIGKIVYGLDAEIVGIEIDKSSPGEKPLREKILTCANDLARKLKLKRGIEMSNLSFENGYLGGGYGVVGDLESSAIRLLAEKEGILLDPVYTGRAFGAMLDLIKRGRFTKNDTLLFIHTGGTPALFPYSKDLLK